ncbi:MAG: hypothetical protein HYY78_13030 [Betaproteobacteria bacterium]|nr:hypothetical protein [Betaproteobacteria bacterium]
MSVTSGLRVAFKSSPAYSLRRPFRFWDYAYEEYAPLFLLSIYAWPPVTIAVLTGFQRFFFGGPTKRTYVDRIDSLPWRDLAAFPYRLRRWIGLGRGNPPPMAPGPGLIYRVVMPLVSFLPTAAAMLAPVLFAYWFADGQPGLRSLISDHLLVVGLLFLIFVLYLLSFALSELINHWRAIISILGIRGAVPGLRGLR